MKLCFQCFRKIPSLANRCPYCVSEEQGVGGRIALLVIFITGIIWISKHYDVVKNFFQQ
jgi:hypothetical protein